jgi:hypothetical protein
MPIIMRRVIDHHIETPERSGNVPHRRLNGRDVAQVKWEEGGGRMPLGGDPSGQCLTSLDGKIDKPNPRALRGKSRDHLGADSAGTAADEHPSAAQAWVNGGIGGHGGLPGLVDPVDETSSLRLQPGRRPTVRGLPAG